LIRNGSDGAKPRKSAVEPTKSILTAANMPRLLVGGIDLNKARMRQVIEALNALSPSPNGFTASNVAARVRALTAILDAGDHGSPNGWITIEERLTLAFCVG
jgi:hypothetical protein